MINVLPAVLRIARPSNPVVVTMHGFHEHSYKYRLRVAPMLIAAGYRVFVHALDRAMISRWLNPQTFPSALIPIGSNIPTVEITRRERDEVRAGLGVHSDHTALAVFFGDLRPEKGFSALLRSLREVRSSGVDLRLALLTDMDYLRKVPVYAGELDRLIAETGATEWMKVLERLDGYSVARTMRASDLAIFPFASGACENRGSLLAALANNVPVLTTRGPSTPRNFELDYGVETVPAGDQRALSDRIEALLRNPTEIRILQRKAASAPKMPRWGAIASGMISVYRAALAAQQSQFPSSSVAMGIGR
jgi:glycosyltransferase involved in cell wall biosynthesis